MRKILLVKMSSMGDLVHNLPLVSDILAHDPEAQIDWVAEEAYVPIPSLHPGVRRVIPVAWRRWRKQLTQARTWREMRAFKTALQAEQYDLILDTQGLWKSLAVARLAHGRIVGGDRHSIKEGGVARFYDQTLPIAWSRHVIDRCRVERPPLMPVSTTQRSACWVLAAPTTDDGLQTMDHSQPALT